MGQGCGICSKDASIECVNCKNKYCNIESLVQKQCFNNIKNKNEICKTKFDIPCYMMRNENNSSIY